MGERFERWAERVTASGEYDLTRLTRFVTSVKNDWQRTGQKPYSPWWRRIQPRELGKGRVPHTMRHPSTKEKFVFPMFEIQKGKPGQPVVAKAVEPLCPSCGSAMVRRFNRKDGGEFFGCVNYPECRGCCEAWVSIEAGERSTAAPAEEKVEEEKVEEAKAGEQTPTERMISRIVEIVELARKVIGEHGMNLPIGYRTVHHLARLTRLVGDPDAAWRLWIDARVSEQEREKMDAAGLPKGAHSYGISKDAEPAWYHMVGQILDLGLPVMLVSESGLGKTRFAAWYAKTRQKSLYMTIGSDDMAGRELWVARRDASKGETKNILGPAAKAAKEGEVLFLDEIDGFSANSLLPLNAILNGDRQLEVPVLGALEVSEDIRIIAAANTNGRSKDRTYTARNRLDGATLNRFAVIVRCDFESKIARKVAEEALVEKKIVKVKGKK